MLEEWLKNYEETVKYAGIKIEPKILFITTIALIILFLAISSFFDITLGILASIVVADIGIGLPFFIADRKQSRIEERLPDVLHHIATTLKTGGTILTALTEVTRVNYGPINQYVEQMLREVQEGETFEGAFMHAAQASRSPFFQKAATIIIAAKRAGGALVDTLTAMAEDIRALYRLKRERKSRTFLQFLFIVVAGIIVAPFIFGIVKSVLQILINVGGGGLTYVPLVGMYDMLFKIYVLVEASVCTLGAVQVREGRWEKAIVYIPIAILVSYIIYTIVATTFIQMISYGLTF